MLIPTFRFVGSLSWAEPSSLNSSCSRWEVGRRGTRDNDSISDLTNSQCTCACACACARMHTHTHTHARARTHAHTHIHTHTLYNGPTRHGRRHLYTRPLPPLLHLCVCVTCTVCWPIPYPALSHCLHFAPEGPAQPEGRLAEEVEGFGDTVLSWKHCLLVPGRVRGGDGRAEEGKEAY